MVQTKKRQARLGVFLFELFSKRSFSGRGEANPVEVTEKPFKR